MNFLKANKEDVNEIMRLYNEVMKTTFTTWGQGYPSKELIEEDINAGNLYVLKDDNKPIGTIDVVNKDIDNKVFEIGYCYSKSSWGNGYGTEVLSKVISFLFEI